MILQKLRYRLFLKDTDLKAYIQYNHFGEKEYKNINMYIEKICKTKEVLLY